MSALICPPPVNDGKVQLHNDNKNSNIYKADDCDSGNGTDTNKDRNDDRSSDADCSMTVMVM